MRLTSFFANVRKPQNENKVPFKVILPLQLRDFVSSKSRTSKARGCLYEMSLLLACLEENQFEDKNCIPQFKILNQCYDVHEKNMKSMHDQRKQAVPVPNNSNLTHKQTTYLLRSYPTI